MKNIFFIGITVAILLLSSTVAYFIFRTTAAISRDIQKKAAFTIFVPENKSTEWVLDKSSVKYDADIGVLYTNLYTPSKSNKITMTQQVLPDPFTDIPNYSTIFFSKLNEYQELNLPVGKVALTHPSELKGGQSAVANIKGTLMFLHPDKDLKDDDWKTVFKNLKSL